MKNVNLTGIFLGMVNFGVSGFELTSITSKDGEPIDALIRFKDAVVIEEDLVKINEMVYANITTEVKQAVVRIKNVNEVELYIEFTNSEFLDTLD
jgi:hypothetical protein